MFTGSSAVDVVSMAITVQIKGANMSAKIVVNCGKKDLAALKRLGFKVEISDHSGSVFEMIHKHASSRVVGAVLGMGGRGHVLHGSIDDLESGPRLLFAGSGSEMVIVQTNTDLRTSASPSNKDREPPANCGSNVNYSLALEHTILRLAKDVPLRGTDPKHGVTAP